MTGMAQGAGLATGMSMDESEDTPNFGQSSQLRASGHRESVSTTTVIDLEELD